MFKYVLAFEWQHWRCSLPLILLLFTVFSLFCFSFSRSCAQFGISSEQQWSTFVGINLHLASNVMPPESVFQIPVDGALKQTAVPSRGRHPKANSPSKAGVSCFLLPFLSTGLKICQCCSHSLLCVLAFWIQEDLILYLMFIQCLMISKPFNKYWQVWPPQQAWEVGRQALLPLL